MEFRISTHKVALRTVALRHKHKRTHTHTKELKKIKIIGGQGRVLHFFMFILMAALHKCLVDRYFYNLGILACATHYLFNQLIN